MIKIKVHGNYIFLIGLFCAIHKLTYIKKNLKRYFLKQQILLLFKLMIFSLLRRILSLITSYRMYVYILNGNSTMSEKNAKMDFLCQIYVSNYSPFNRISKCSQRMSPVKMGATARKPSRPSPTISCPCILKNASKLFISSENSRLAQLSQMRTCSGVQ